MPVCRQCTLAPSSPDGGRGVDDERHVHVFQTTDLIRVDVERADDDRVHIATNQRFSEEIMPFPRVRRAVYGDIVSAGPNTELSLRKTLALNPDGNGIGMQECDAERLSGFRNAAADRETWKSSLRAARTRSRVFGSTTLAWRRFVTPLTRIRQPLSLPLECSLLPWQPRLINSGCNPLNKDKQLLTPKRAIRTPRCLFRRQPYSSANFAVRR